MDVQKVIGTFEVKKMRFCNDDGSFAVAVCTVDARQTEDTEIPQWITKRADVALAGPLGKGLQRGSLLDIIGATEMSKFGPQVKVSVVAETIRSDHRALFQFLRKLPNIGEQRANAVIKQFGDAEAIMTTLESDWRALTVVDGITDERADEIHVKFQEARAQWSAMKFLCKMDLARWQVARILEKFPNQTVEIITHDPYCLVDINGFPFRTVDNMATKHFDVASNDPRRQVAACKHILAIVLGEGHTYSTMADYEEPSKYVERAMTEIKVDADDLENGFRVGCKLNSPNAPAPFIMVEDKIYRAEIYNAEQDIAALLALNVQGRRA